MKIEAGQWWENGQGERVHVCGVAEEPVEYRVYGIRRGADSGKMIEVLYTIEGWYHRDWPQDRRSLVKHLPECTGWDWKPPKPVDPGEGWRLLEVGEIRQKGDEWLCYDSKEWWPVTSSNGNPYNAADRPVRRRSQPDVPADWQLIGGVPGGMLYFKPTEAT